MLGWEMGGAFKWLHILVKSQKKSYFAVSIESLWHRTNLMFLAKQESRIALGTDVSLCLEMHGFFLVMVDVEYSGIPMILRGHTLCLNINKPEHTSLDFDYQPLK